VKRCCCYISFTLSTSNGLYGNTLDFQLQKVYVTSDFSEELSSEAQLNVVEAKLASFVHKQVWLTLCQKSGEISKSRIRAFVKGTILILLGRMITQPPTAPRPTESRMNDALQP